MIRPGIDNLISWLNINNIQEWSLSLTKDKGGNSYLFKSDPNVPREKELERMRDTLLLCENTIVYVFGKENPKAQTGNFGETWQNTSGQPVTQSQPERVGTTPASMVDIDARIKLAVDQANMAWERKMLDEEKKELRQERREFLADKEGVIGLLVEKAKPFVGGLLGNKQAQAVPVMTGLEDTAPIEVPAIKVRKENEEDSIEEEVFTDEESDRLFDLMARFKKCDPDYITILSKLADFCESGEEISIMNGLLKLDYPKIKAMILDL